MSLIKAVVAAIEDLGSAEVDALVPIFPDKTREQVMRAVHNASRLGHIEKDEERKPMGPEHTRGAYLATWRVTTEKPSGRSRRSGRPVSSVFELGSLAG